MPDIRVPSDVILDALRLACRAPSLHNSQPWCWVITDDEVQLFADPERLLRSTDGSGGEAVISCGAALHHFRVAMAAAGWATVVRRFPDEHDRRHLATVEFAPTESVSTHQQRRADAILLRHTERLPLAPPTEWLTGIAETLTQARAVRIDHLADDERPMLAEASHLVNLLRAADPAYQDELTSSISGFSSHDGIPRASLASQDQQQRVDVGRTFPTSPGPPRHAGATDDRSAILILSTVDDSPESVLRCGEALSALLLDATTAGMATCTVSHVTEVPSGRDVVAALLDNRLFPQMLVRVGRAPILDPPPPATPRRPLDDVVEIRRSTT